MPALVVLFLVAYVAASTAITTIPCERAWMSLTCIANPSKFGQADVDVHHVPGV